MTIDITAFDSVGVSEKGKPLMLKNEDGITDTGITMNVIGKHADAITKFNSRLVREFMREQQLAERRGKLMEPKNPEDLRNLDIEGASVRVTGWDGPTQQFSKELLKDALKRNPHWIKQIIDFSDDLGNFTSGSVTS